MRLAVYEHVPGNFEIFHAESVYDLAVECLDCIPGKDYVTVVEEIVSSCLFRYYRINLEDCLGLASPETSVRESVCADDDVPGVAGLIPVVGVSAYPDTCHHGTEIAVFDKHIAGGGEEKAPGPVVTHAAVPDYHRTSSRYVLDSQFGNILHRAQVEACLEFVAVLFSAADPEQGSFGDRSESLSVHEPQDVPFVSEMVAFLLEMSERCTEYLRRNYCVDLHVDSVDVGGIIQHALERAVFQNHGPSAVHEVGRVSRDCNHSRRPRPCGGGHSGHSDIL